MNDASQGRRLMTDHEKHFYLFVTMLIVIKLPRPSDDQNSNVLIPIRYSKIVADYSIKLLPHARVPSLYCFFKSGW